MKYLMTCLLLFLISPGSHAEIYQWEDSAGRIHYGSQCPKEPCRPVRLTPLSTYAAPQPPITGANDRTGQTQEIPPGSAQAGPTPHTITTASVHCLDGIETAIGPGRVDPFQDIEPTIPGPQEYQNIYGLLMKLRGLWHGTIEEVNCTANGRDTENEIRHYQVNVRISGDLKGGFELQFDETETRYNIRKTKVVKILITRERLRVGDTHGNPDSKQWAVKLLESGPEKFVYLWQYRRRTALGGSLPLMLLRSLHLSDKTLVIRELNYTRNVLGNMRTILLER